MKIPEMGIPHLPEMKNTFIGQLAANIPTNKIPEMGISLLLEMDNSDMWCAFCMPAGKSLKHLKRTLSLPAMATKVLVDDPTEQITAFVYIKYNTF